jgi:hypothetical protein
MGIGKWSMKTMEIVEDLVWLLQRMELIDHRSGCMDKMLDYSEFMRDRYYEKGE